MSLEAASSQAHIADETTLERAGSATDVANMDTTGEVAFAEPETSMEVKQEETAHAVTDEMHPAGADPNSTLFSHITLRTRALYVVAWSASLPRVVYPTLMSYPKP